MCTYKAIGHLDADCFYVSAERVRDPFLVGKPVGVLGNQGACVIAKSYEMKKAGVQTGEPIWDAVQKCPEGIYVKRDFRWYEVLSRQMLEVVRELSPDVEYYSIDEFFFNAWTRPAQSLQDLAETLRDRILEKVNVPVTVGIARTKSLAKLISDTAKPFGAMAVTDPTEEQNLLAQRPVEDITGIAKRRANRLAPYGIRTCLDFARADSRLIRQLLTVMGERLWCELNGQPAQPLHTSRPPHKMIARGGSLGETTTDYDRVWAWTVRNLERLIEELDHHQVHVGKLVVWLSYREDFVLLGHTSLDAPTARFDLLLEAAQHCVRKAWAPGHGVNRMNLLAADLHYRGAVQLGLFDPPAEREAALAEAKRQINQRIGRFALRSAATLPLVDAYRDSAHSYDICDIRGKICF